MKKQSDEQLMEFEKKDLGHDVKTSHSAVKVTARSRPTSILLPESLIKKLKKAAAKKGLGYQTLLKMILTEQLPKYS